MSEYSPFAEPLYTPEKVRYYRLLSIPPAPFDLKISLLSRGMAESIRREVIGDGFDFGMDAVILNGEIWVKPGEVIDLLSPMSDPFDPDGGCYIAPELWIDREELARDLAEAKIAYEIAFDKVHPKDPTFGPVAIAKGEAE